MVTNTNDLYKIYPYLTRLLLSILLQIQNPIIHSKTVNFILKMWFFLIECLNNNMDKKKYNML